MSETGDAFNDETAGARPRRARLKWYWRIAGFLLVGYGVLYMLMPILNSVGVESLRCEVVDAEPKTSSGGSRGSASTASVLVETSNCGKIVVSNGVTFDSQEEVAASFRAGSEYEFDLGWFSRVITMDIRHGIPSARDYRLVD